MSNSNCETAQLPLNEFSRPWFGYDHRTKTIARLVGWIGRATALLRPLANTAPMQTLRTPRGRNVDVSGRIYGSAYATNIQA